MHFLQTDGQNASTRSAVRWLFPLATPDMWYSEITPVDFAADSVIESVINDSTDNNESTVYEPVTDPAALDESSIYDPPAAVEGDDFAVTYQILQDSTTKGRPKLVDSRGYCYNIKRRRPNATDWQCTIRRKVNIVT